MGSKISSRRQSQGQQFSGLLQRSARAFGNATSMHGPVQVGMTDEEIERKLREKGNAIESSILAAVRKELED